MATSRTWTRTCLLGAEQLGKTKLQACMICVRVRCCILTTGSSETILVLFVKQNIKISALCELSPKATSPAKKVRFVVHVDFVSFDVVCRGNGVETSVHRKLSNGTCMDTTEARTAHRKTTLPSERRRALLYSTLQQQCFPRLRTQCKTY